MGGLKIEGPLYWDPVTYTFLQCTYTAIIHQTKIPLHINCQKFCHTHRQWNRSWTRVCIDNVDLRYAFRVCIQCSLPPMNYVQTLIPPHPTLLRKSTGLVRLGLAGKRSRKSSSTGFSSLFIIRIYNRYSP